MIGALTLREMGTRFGRDNLGYIWLFLEPMMLGGAIGLLHLASGHSMPGGLNPFVFWVVGYIPFYLFRGIVNRAPTGIAGNQSLLYHRHVTILDIMLSRHLLEFAAVGIAFMAYLVLFGTVLGDWPREPGLIVLGMVGIWLFLRGGPPTTPWPSTGSASKPSNGRRVRPSPSGRSAHRRSRGARPAWGARRSW